MTKKPGFWMALVAVVLVVAAVGWGWNYYQDRYLGSEYYARIPADFDVTPETQHSSTGEDVGLGKDYDLTAYDAQGNAKHVSFTVMGDNAAKYPQPGDYLRVTASEQIVLKWSLIDRDEVPKGALARLGD